ncbi:antiterminator Q family protein [Cellvibrio sp. ARAG 10.3]|uniref:antiterminator Q family protein n=1 Tax=Cellvibrio sp. ARAG 10.3 TaxID=3451358 RepID=UPI003F44F621
MKKYLLMIEQWGLWVRGSRGADLKARSSMLEMMQLVKPSRSIYPSITDDDALRIDRAVAALGKADQQLKEIIFLRFVCDYSMQQIAARFNASRDSVTKQLGQATGFVAGVLAARD